MAERFSIDVTTRFPGRFYVAYDHFSDSSRTKVVYSTSVGNTLQFQPMVSVKSLTNYHMGSFEVSDSDPNYAYIGGRALGRVNLVSGKRELVYGFEFFPRGINEHPDVRDMVIRPSSVPGKDELLVACDGGIAQSDNSSLSWRSLNGQGLTTNQYFGFDFKPENGHIVAGAMDNYTHYFDGNAWTLRYQGDGGWTEIDDHNSDMVYFVSNDRWLVNRRGMANDSDLQMDSLVNTGDGSGFKLEIHTTPDPVRPNVFWAGDISFLKTVTVVGGPPWPWSAPIFTHPASNGSHRLQDLAISIDDHKTMYWSYTGPKYLNENSPSQVINLLFRSRDGGQTYTDLTQNLKLEDGVTPVHGFFFVKDLEIDPEDANHVFAGISGYDWDTLRDQARHKVYETTDGGDHWVDISKGLSPFSVSHLCYQNGSGGVVYAATDAGVFRFDPIRRIWECFNRDLPPASCTKVMVDYCRNRLLVSTYGRGMWEADLPATPDYHITSSRTWDAGTVRFFAGNVIVDPGVVLTVKGSVNFNPGKRLVVDRGAKLLLQGGTLTCACGMWAGVDVYGTFNRFQSLLPNGLPSFQGIVEVVGGTIENAITGISTSLHDSQGNYYWSSFGGIVRCSNARFLNNKRDVEMLSYVHPNMSYFRNCLFETNRALRDGLKPTTHVSMWNVRKIPFTGCSFRHADTTGYPVLQRGNGITAVDATYMVDWRCTSSSQNGCTGGVPSTFEGLNYGVHHESNNPLLSPAIRHAAFVRNTVVGAKLRGAHFAVIEDNSFDVGTTLNASGLYLDRCTKYSLQGNAFDATRPSNQARFGFVVRESGDDYNFAYNNSFSNLPYALAALEDNEGPSSVDGLIMNCNDFTNCTFGIMALGTSANSGVGESQGRAVVNPLAVPTNLVRNRYFGACSAANENKFLVSHPNQYRIDHRCNSDSVCQPLPQPACSDIALDVTIASVILVRPSHCQRIGGASLPVIEPNITASTKRLVEQQAILSAKVDGGNTADRLAALAKSTKASAIKADLLRYSPYLSDTVLVTMLRKQPLLPAGTLQTLLLANSPLSPKVLARLPAANLPQTVQKKIAAAQKGVSQRELLENDMFTARNDKTFWEDEKIRFLLRDSLDPRSEDNLVATLTQLNYARCYQQQARAMQTDFATSDASSTNGLQNCKGGSGDLEQLVRQLDVQAKECFGAEERFPDITHEKAYPVMPKSFALAQGFLEKLMELRTPESYLLPPTVAGTGVATAVTDPTRFKLYQNADANQLLLDFDAAIGAQFRVKVLDLQGKSLLDSVVLPNTINTLRLAKHKAGQYRYELLRDGLAWKSGQIQLN